MHRAILSYGHPNVLASRIGRLNPVDSRGWCMQEHQLAPRIVHFNNSEMLWECLQDAYCECAGIDPGRRDMICPWQWDWTALPKLRKQSWSTILASSVFYELWTAWWICVEQFSLRGLTQEKDRLPAIAGIATQLPEIVIKSNVAGLLERSIPVDLLWSTIEHKSYRTTFGNAPTWSWGSVIGVIERPTLYPNPVSRVLSIEKEPWTTKQGRVVHTEKLKLEAICFRVASMKTTIGVNGENFLYLWGFEDDMKDPLNTIIGCSGANLDDVPKDAGEWGNQSMNEKLRTLYSDIRCICIGQMDNGVIGALLVASSNHCTGAFERVGVCEVGQRSFKDSVYGPQEITLV